jgi:hypothetical protein
MQRFNIRLEGRTPLLVNRLTEEELLSIGGFVDKKKFKAPVEPREAAEKRLYLTTDKACATVRSCDVRRLIEVPCASIRDTRSLYEDFDPACVVET